ncbi:MAG: hypothetical protein QXN19_03125 [Sulfolobales archaeon]
MKLEDLEKILLSNLDEFFDSCRGICRSDIPFIPSLKVHDVLEGCEQCLLRNLMDVVEVKSLNIVLRDGNYLEFFRLDDVIIELSNDAVFIIPLDDFNSRISELRDFNLITDEDVDALISWFSSG